MIKNVLLILFSILFAGILIQSPTDAAVSKKEKSSKKAEPVKNIYQSDGPYFNAIYNASADYYIYLSFGNWNSEASVAIMRAAQKDYAQMKRKNVELILCISCAKNCEDLLQSSLEKNGIRYPVVRSSSIITGEIPNAPQKCTQRRSAEDIGHFTIADRNGTIIMQDFTFDGLKKWKKYCTSK